MALQTLVHVECNSSGTPFLVIRNAGPANAPGNPIGDATAVVPQVWDQNALAWVDDTAALCATITNQFVTLETICGEHVWANLPDALHCPNQHYGIVLYESNATAHDTASTYNNGDRVAGPDGFTYQWDGADGGGGTAPPSAGWTLITDDSGYQCCGTETHWTGDMDYELSIKSSTSCVPLGQSFIADTQFNVDGELTNVDPTGFAVNSSAGTPVVTSAFGANRASRVVIDTTGMAVGDVVSVAITGGLPGSTTGPQCRTMTQICSFEVCPVSSAVDPFTFAVDGTGVVANETDGTYGAGSFGRCFEDILCVTATYDTTGDSTGDSTFVEAIQHLIMCQDQIKGAGFDSTTDSLEAIRDQGDAAWVTGGGVGGDPFANPATCAGQFGLAANATWADAFCAIIEDSSEVQTSLADGGFTDGLIDTLTTDVAAVQACCDANTTAIAAVPAAVDTLLVTNHGSGTWTTGGGGAALTAQDVRDALLLAPSAGAPATGSVDEHLDSLVLCCNSNSSAIAALPATLATNHGSGSWEAGAASGGLSLSTLVPGTTGGADASGLQNVGEVLACACDTAAGGGGSCDLTDIATSTEVSASETSILAAIGAIDCSGTGTGSGSGDCPTLCEIKSVVYEATRGISSGGSSNCGGCGCNRSRCTC